MTTTVHPQPMNFELPTNIKIEKHTFQKMLFLTNALEKGWTVKKNNDTYVFSKKHEQRQEFFQENYLETFISDNITSTNFLNS